MSVKAKNGIYGIAKAALFTAIIVACACIRVSAGPIPFTLQTFAVLCAGGLLGLKYSLLSVACYIALGAVGLPVFSGFTGGIGVVVGPAGGFIFGLLGMAAAMGFFSDKFGRKVLPLIIAAVVGTVICYAFGTAWYAVYADVSVIKALSVCVVPFLITDSVKAAAAILISCRIPVHN